jgi:hypothetical protein
MKQSKEHGKLMEGLKGIVKDDFKSIRQFAIANNENVCYLSELFANKHSPRMNKFLDLCKLVGYTVELKKIDSNE